MKTQHKTVEEQTKLKASKRKEIVILDQKLIKQRTEKQRKINGTKSQLFEKSNKIDKPLARLRKKRKFKLLESEKKRGHDCQPYRNFKRVIL